MSGSMDKPAATISLDLDNLWAYLKTHGDPEWQDYPSYIPLFIPRILSFLDQHQLQMTFFVVGKDASIPANIPFFKALKEKGHEFGNHSFHHEPWMEDRSKEEILKELQQAHEAIALATESPPIGFRGPGFCRSKALLSAVQEMGYIFDASLFPTWIGPFARFYYFSQKGHQRSKKTQKLFGSIRNSFFPLNPFRWNLNAQGILEVPVTTMPLLRLPFHFSYLMWLNSFSKKLALSWFKAALALCRLRRISPSLLLHPLDFLGKDDGVGLSFFPGMNLSSQDKLSLADEAIQLLAKEFTIHSLSSYAKTIIGMPFPKIECR